MAGHTEIVAETPELVLRHWRRDDIDDYERHCNTAEVMRWLGGKQTPRQVLEDVEWFVAKQASFGSTFWVMERKKDNAFLGWCGLVVLEDGDENVPAELVGELEIGW